MSTNSSYQPSRFRDLTNFARRRVVTLALTVAIPLLGLLLALELRSQARLLSLWKAEFADREITATPDILGRVDLEAWRTLWGTKYQELNRALSSPMTQDDTAERSEAGEEDADASTVWPQWWGNSDEVGASPFDHVPTPLKQGESKRRVMFLTSYWDYLERMNTHTYELVDGK
jgi:hypothetical protein